MAAIPRSSTEIVPIHQIMNAQVMRLESWRLTTLSPELTDNDQALQWCARRRLVRNSVTCTNCNRPCTLRRYAQGIDGRRWCCKQMRGKLVAWTSMEIRLLSKLMKPSIFTVNTIADNGGTGTGSSEASSASVENVSWSKCPTDVR